MAEGAGAGGGLSGLLGDVNIQSIAAWSIIGSLIGAALRPFQEQLQALMLTVTPSTLLSPADVASAVVRGFMAYNDAAGEANRGGISPDRFKILSQLAGMSLAPEEAAEAWRRGFIPADSGSPDAPGYNQAIAQGNLRNMWGPILQKLATADPSPADVLRALVTGQTDEATAQELYHRFGGNPDYFELMFHTEGQGPSPAEAATMANRGIIPWEGTGADATTFEQAFLESAWRNKWLASFRAIAQYYPPPRTITALVKEGALTDDQALKLWQEQGLSAEMAQAYLQSAHTTAASKTKELAESTVVKLYTDQLIDAGQAGGMLESIGYNAQDSGFILAVADLQITEANLRTAVSRIRSLYVGHKIDKTTAINALNTLQVPSTQVDGIMTIWELEQADNVKIPSESQIVDAYKYNIIDQATAQSKLQELGYSPYDAWLLLSVRLHGPQPNQPSTTAVTGAS